MYSTHIDEVVGQQFDGPHRRTIKHLHAPWITAGTRIWVGISEVPPGSSSNAHRHQEQEESFFVHEGEGQIVIEGVSHDVRPGDLVVVAPGEEHQLRNTGNTTLRVLATVVPPFERDQFAAVHELEVTR